MEGKKEEKVNRNEKEWETYRAEVIHGRGMGKG